MVRRVGNYRLAFKCYFIAHIDFIYVHECVLAALVRARLVYNDRHAACGRVPS